VPAPFDDAALIQDEDLIGGLDGGEPVGDDHGGTSGQGVGQSLLDEELRFRVQMRGGLVQDHDGRVLQQAPRNREALLFPA